MLSKRNNHRDDGLFASMRHARAQAVPSECQTEGTNSGAASDKSILFVNRMLELHMVKCSAEEDHASALWAE
jgi:hypothetical protein